MKPTTIAVTGSTGFVGTHLCHSLARQGFTVIPVVRDHYATVQTLADRMDGADAIVNLAGAPIITRWTRKNLNNIVESRVSTTEQLVDAIGKLRDRPRVLVSASAVGIYPDGKRQTESNFTLKRDFLGNLCMDWEQAAIAANGMGIRTALLRIGIVLGKGGGMIGKIKWPFLLGLGGRIGSGTQGMSWIHLDDLCALILFLIGNNRASGIYNGTAPEPMTNARFTRTLGRVIQRPTLFPVPEFALRLIFGEGARVLTSGQLVYPERALQEGFEFQYGTLKSALQEIFNKT